MGYGYAMSSVLISVYRREDAELLDNYPGAEAVDRWLDELDQRRLFGATIGSPNDVRTFWEKPGKRLGLVLVRSFTEGIRIEGRDLDVLEHEMQVLVHDWFTSIGDDEVKTWSYLSERGERSFSVPLFFWLVRWADDVSSATRIARRVGGFVDIGE